MLNMLIADDNMHFGRNLMNAINCMNTNVRVCNVSVNGEETIKVLNSEENIDMVLLDLKMPKCNGLEILENLTEDKKERYKDSIIIISGEIEMISKVSHNVLIHSFIHKDIGFEKMIERIN